MPVCLWKLAIILLVATGCAAASATGASSNLVVSMTVPSATSLTNSCTAPSANRFGTVLPGTTATTATGAGACTVAFGSSNDTSMLRLSMRDNAPTAMSSPSTAWSQSRSGGMLALTVDRSTSSIGFAGGYYGLAMRTLDGGVSWDYSYDASASGDYVFDIEHAPGSNDVWVAGAGKASISSTTNGVSSAPANPTWVDHHAALVASGFPTWMHVVGVAVISPSTWLLAGEYGRIAKTTDGGASFTSFVIPGVTQLGDIDALDANTIYAAGSSGSILKTTLGGDNAGEWTVSTHAWCGCWFQRISISDATHVYFTSNGGYVMRWDGSAFASSFELGDKVYQPLGVASPASAPNVVYVSTTRGMVYKSTDSGASYTPQEVPTGSSLASIDARSATDLLTVGSSETVATGNGTSWTLQVEDPGHRSQLDIAAHPSDGRIAIAVGGQGRATRTTDSGATWTNLATGVTNNLQALTWTDGGRIVAVGRGGRIIVSDDGGTTWSTRTSSTTEELLDVAASGARYLWAVGRNGTIVASNNGGESWTAQVSGTPMTLESVTAASDTVAVAAGANGIIRRTSNGGASWVASATGPANWTAITGLGASSNGSIYLATRFEGPFRSIDGGANFTHLAGYPDGDSAEAIAVAGDTIATIDYWGSFTVSRDAGATWTTQPQSSLIDTHIHTSLALVDPHTFWVTDDLGGVRRQTEDSAIASQIADYAGGANFATSAATGTFGVCLQSLASASVAAGWTVDGGTCIADDGDPWKPVPQVPTKVATAAAGAPASATFVWGMGAKLTQAPGTYRASIAFEALAPAV